MRDEPLNETLFLGIDHARVEIAAWVEDCNRERPHSSLGYETPAALAAELDKQWPAPLRPADSAAQLIASAALMRSNVVRLQSELGESWGLRRPALIAESNMHPNYKNCRLLCRILNAWACRSSH